MKYFGLFDTISLYLDPNILKSLIITLVVGGGLSIKNLMQKGINSLISDLIPLDLFTMAGGGDGKDPRENDRWFKWLKGGAIPYSTYKDLKERQRKLNQKDDSSKDSKKPDEKPLSDNKTNSDNTTSDALAKPPVPLYPWTTQSQSESQEETSARSGENFSAVFSDEEEDINDNDSDNDDNNDSDKETTVEEKIDIYKDIIKELEEDAQKAKENGEDYSYMLEDIDKLKKEIDNLKESKDK